MTLTTNQTKALELVNSGANVYIGGPGGTGKSFLMNYLRTPDSLVVAPTGIAALNVGGATIHSTFKLNLGIHNPNENKRPSRVDIFLKAKRLIIDEISMVRADLFQAMDNTLRAARRSNQPFGGLQVIALGDFFQLPPVITPKEEKAFYTLYDSKYAFSTRAWFEANIEHVELDEIIRQTDEEMIFHLQQIRQKGSKYPEAVRYFNKAKNTIGSAVYLMATNRLADERNSWFYEEIAAKEHFFTAEIEGKFPYSMAPVQEIMPLKVRTRVMLTANGGTFMNGEVGFISKVNSDSVEVHLDDRVVTVYPYTWNNIEYTVSGGKVYQETVGTFKQLPIKYGWASTIHKAQGKTLDSCCIDLGRGAFAPGMTYVALSRARSIQGLEFYTPLNNSDVIVDKEVKDFYEQTETV